MAKSYKEKFKHELDKHGADDPGDVMDKKKFFKGMDKKHQTGAEKKGDYSDSDSDGKKDESRTRAALLIAKHLGIEEGYSFYRDGTTHTHRANNGMKNVVSRRRSGMNAPNASQKKSTAAIDTTSRTNVNIAKPGI